MDKNNKKFIIIIFIIIFGGVILYMYSTHNSVENDNAGVTDGIDNTGTGSDAGQDTHAGWKTYSDESRGVSFRYPADLGLSYVHVVDWPPQINLTGEAYSCTEAGQPTDRAGGTEERTIGGVHYCVTEVSEGAAGSVYKQYAYAFDKRGQAAILTFTVREVQCANYDEDESAQCSLEQASFDPDTLASSIAKTLQIEG